MPAIGSKLTRAVPLSSAPASFEPKPLTRAKPLTEATKAGSPAALKHPALPEGGPRYSPLVQNTGDAGVLMATGGTNKLTAPQSAEPKMYLDKPGTTHQKDVFGGTAKASLGSASASTTTTTAAASPLLGPGRAQRAPRLLPGPEGPRGTAGHHQRPGHRRGHRVQGEAQAGRLS